MSSAGFCALEVKHAIPTPYQQCMAINQPGVLRCRVWDMRLQKLVKTMDTGKEVTSIEIIQEGQHITTADGNEVTAHDFTSILVAVHCAWPFIAEHALRVLSSPRLGLPTELGTLDGSAHEHC